MLTFKRKDLSIWVFCILLRIVNACIVRTYFDADEYWQSIEVAHERVFGYGYLTWEWRVGLRSCLYVLPFLVYFYILKVTGLDRFIFLVIYGPRVGQAVMAGTTDYLVYRLAYKYYKSQSIAGWALCMSLCSWVNIAYSTRTLSNNLETFLTTLALLYWPKNVLMVLTFVGLAILNRPSAITHWIIPLTVILYKSNTKTLTKISALTFSVIAFGIVVDTVFYKRFTVSWYNFIHFNVFQKVSSFYGIEAWYYYLVSVLPALCGTMLPLIILAWDGKAWLFIAGSVFFNSLLPHKEIRFILPLVPVLMVLGGKGISRLQKYRSIIATLIIITNISVGLYMVRYHGAGTVPVMEYLHHNVKEDGKVFFATPCHSTPYYGYLHRPLEMPFVTCEPPLTTATIDESILFYRDPIAYLNPLVSGISHLIMFEGLAISDGMHGFLESFKFKECWRHFHSHFHPDKRRRGDLIVYCKF